jgi:hypothetical protein
MSRGLGKREVAMTKVERIQDCKELINEFVGNVAAGVLSSIICHAPSASQAALWDYARSAIETVVQERLATGPLPRPVRTKP